MIDYNKFNIVLNNISHQVDNTPLHQYALSPNYSIRGMYAQRIELFRIDENIEQTTTMSNEEIDKVIESISEFNIRYRTQLIGVVYCIYLLYMKNIKEFRFVLKIDKELNRVYFEDDHVQYKCPNCGRMYELYMHRILNNHETKFCCSYSTQHKDPDPNKNKVLYHEGKYTDCEILKEVERLRRLAIDDIVTYFNTYSPNRKRFKLIDKYTIRCNKLHFFSIRDTMSANKANSKEPIECPICKYTKDVALFDLLKELKANHYIKQIYGTSVIPKGTKIQHRILTMSAIYTYNDKKHLTGKIVFNDYNGEQQAKARANKLVYRWLELDKINDYEYCKDFLYDYFDEINKKNHLK